MKRVSQKFKFALWSFFVLYILLQFQIFTHSHQHSQDTHTIEANCEICVAVGQNFSVPSNDYTFQSFFYYSVAKLSFSQTYHSLILYHWPYATAPPSFS